MRTYRAHTLILEINVGRGVRVRLLQLTGTDQRSRTVIHMLVAHLIGYLHHLCGLVRLLLGNSTREDVRLLMQP